MKKIVLTGGPCSGKTTVMNHLKKRFQDRIVFVPEVATMLLSSGFPVPGQDMAWSSLWQDAFQSAVLPLQLNLEKIYAVQAQELGLETMLCDRGVLDGAAYTPGGLEEFCRQYQVDEHEMYDAYQNVIHLESLATAQPSLYGQEGNANRYEGLEEAQALELRTRLVWSGHPCRHFVTSGAEIEAKIRAVEAIITNLI